MSRSTFSTNPILSIFPILKKKKKKKKKNCKSIRGSESIARDVVILSAQDRFAAEWVSDIARTFTTRANAESLHLFFLPRNVESILIFYWVCYISAPVNNTYT